MQDLEKYKALIVPILKRYDIKQAAIFGSLAKGTMTRQSDIDLLIEPSTGFTLLTLLKLEEEIAQLTNHKIDIVEYGALKNSIKNEVEQTLVPIL
ncbi:nucleotidyltransferase domain-containing protein [uncultured Mucilaginibacter sp.]|uniref:nucleotidyltransferase family protein n=1 Tax=uncultured Mucilaginibacter sp. TaxID=797541 RepID=UPI0025F18A54|nr:nucleotidyltransferase domain-containing protein [uncultured Mucilaginibacter sp.]